MSRRLIEPFNRRYRDGSLDPMFHALTGVNGISQLPTTWTTNGVTKNPSFMYSAEDITAVGTWPARYGDDLTLTGSGTDPTINVNSFGNDSDIGAVKFNATAKGYLAPNIAQSQFGKNDIVLKFIFRAPSEATTSQYYFLGGNYTFMADDGIGLWICNGLLNIRARDDAAHMVTLLEAIIPGAVYDLVLTFEYGGSMRSYLNGVATDTSSVAALVGDIGITDKFAFSGTPAQFGCFDTGQILYAACWQGLAWFAAGGFDQDDNVSECFHKWAGTYATAEGDAEPTGNSRDCAGYMKKWNATESRYDLILCGENLPRITRVKDSAGDIDTFWLDEVAATNVNPNSWDLSDFTPTLASIADADTAGPDSSFLSDGIVGDAGSAEHFITETMTATTTSSTLSCYAKKGDITWLKMENATTAVECNFDVDNVVVGTGTGSIEYLGNGWVRCMMPHTSTIAAQTINIQPITDDSTTDYTGDGSTVNMYVWGVQLEAGNKATSLIITDGATATRLKDQLRYDGTDNTGDQQGTISAEILTDDYSNAVDCTVLSLNDGGAANDSIELELDTTTGVAKFDIVAGGAAQAAVTGTTDCTDGVKKTVRGIYANNDARLLVDNTSEGTPDTTCTIPNDIDRVDIGQSATAAEQLNGYIRNVKIFRGPTNKG